MCDRFGCSKRSFRSVVFAPTETDRYGLTGEKGDNNSVSFARYEISERETSKTFWEPLRDRRSDGKMRAPKYLLFPSAAAANNKIVVLHDGGTRDINRRRATEWLKGVVVGCGASAAATDGSGWWRRGRRRLASRGQNEVSRAFLLVFISYTPIRACALYDGILPSPRTTATISLRTLGGSKIRMGRLWWCYIVENAKIPVGGLMGPVVYAGF